MMDNNMFKFELGEVVIINPISGEMGVKGLIVGRAEYIDGSVGYNLSSTSRLDDGLLRHWLSEFEIQKATQ